MKIKFSSSKLNIKFQATCFNLPENKVKQFLEIYFYCILLFARNAMTAEACSLVKYCTDVIG